ncbi:MAG TPA: type II CAAX endopeptidase family protein [Prolixibacteraceae bacterium]
MEQDLDSALLALTKQAELICHGNFENTDEIYQLVDPEKYPESLVNFVESFGMMTLKLEAREIHLGNIIEELKDKNNQLEESIIKRNHLNFVFMNTVVLLSFFSFVLALLKTSADVVSKVATTFVVSRVIEFAILTSAILLIVRSKLPLSEFGLTLKNWPRAVKESLVATIAAILLGALLKIVLVRFNLSDNTYIIRLSNLEWSFAFYIIVAPLQEFLGRGVVQGTLQRIVPGKNGGLMAIVLTSLVFGTLHLYISAPFALASIAGSFLWGWLYLRHNTIVGISISHLFIGLWMGLLGFF